MNRKLSDFENVIYPPLITLCIWYHTGSLAYGIGAYVLGFIIKAAITSVKATSKNLDPKDKQLLDKLPHSFYRRVHYLSYMISGCIMILLQLFLLDN